MSPTALGESLTSHACILVVKWDRLFAHLLGLALRNGFPTADIQRVETSAQARLMIAGRRYDLVIAGVSFSDEDGLQFGRFAATSPNVSAMLLVTIRKDALTLRFLHEHRRVSAFDSAGDDVAQFLPTVGGALQGRRYLSPTLRELLNGGNGSAHSLYPQLTLTEEMVFAVICDGCDDKAASRSLGIEPSSVHAHRKRIMRKLGVHSRDALFRCALELGAVRILPDGRTSRPSFEALEAAIEERKRLLSERRRARKTKLSRRGETVGVVLQTELA